jgi:CRISPR-associated RAMP protein (TIGR02581 family)
MTLHEDAPRTFFHDELQNRLEVSGVLHCETAVLVGTGRETAQADIGVMRDFFGRPFIPGSSMKGALRSAVERRAQWLGLRSCRLADGEPCLTTQDNWGAVFRGENIPGETAPERLQRQKMLIEDPAYLCDSCRVFGSPVFAGKVRVDDLPLQEEFERLGDRLVEVRDGVGIDRDTGTSAYRIKYNFEVVPSLTAFRFHMEAENLERAQLALLALGLCELADGAIAIGGASSRGLGRCHLDIGRLNWITFEGGDQIDVGGALLARLSRAPRAPRVGDVPDPRAFLVDAVRRHLEKGEG